MNGQILHEYAFMPSCIVFKRGKKPLQPSKHYRLINLSEYMLHKFLTLSSLSSDEYWYLFLDRTWMGKYCKNIVSYFHALSIIMCNHNHEYRHMLLQMSFLAELHWAYAARIFHSSLCTTVFRWWHAQIFDRMWLGKYCMNMLSCLMHCIQERKDTLTAPHRQPLY